MSDQTTPIPALAHIRRPYFASAIGGFSLIEVMVSVLIISLAILGTTGLLIKGVSNAKTSSLRSVAAMQASSLASAMYSNRIFWANRTQALGFASENTTFTSVSSAIPVTATLADGCNAAECTPAQLAAADVNAWVHSIASALPGAKSDVSCPQVADDVAHNCLIRITWIEKFIDTSTSASTPATATSGERSYFLHVEP